MADVLTAIVSGVVALGAIWLKYRLDRLDRMAKPTSNGFAAKVTDALDRIEARTDRTESRCERIASRQDRLERLIHDHLNKGDDR